MYKPMQCSRLNKIQSISFLPPNFPHAPLKSVLTPHPHRCPRSSRTWNHTVQSLMSGFLPSVPRLRDHLHCGPFIFTAAWCSLDGCTTIRLSVLPWTLGMLSGWGCDERCLCVDTHRSWPRGWRSAEGEQPDAAMAACSAPAPAALQEDARESEWPCPRDSQPSSPPPPAPAGPRTS